MLNTLNQVTAQEDEALQEVSTGKKLNVPSDDPAGMAMLIENKADQSDCDQYQQNITTLLSSMQTADSALNSVTNSLSQAITLGVEGAGGTLSSSDLSAVAGEVSGIRNQVLALANSTFNGSYLFGGAKTSTPPFVQSSTDPSGVSYDGDSTVTHVPVGDGISIAANQPGDDLFTTGTNVFGALQDLTTALSNGTGIEAATEELRSAFDQFSSERVSYGTAMQQLNAENDFQSNNELQLQTQENTLSGVDMATAISQLTNAENARNATLEAASRIGQTTLLDYLGASTV
jgi:flagellar hook-associated protein 3 FlgL